MWLGTMSRSAPASVVVAAALFDADGFGDGDLDVVDVAAVPDGLEDSVGEAKRQDVLDGFFAEVVIDAVDLAFGGNFEKLLVEGFGGIEIVAERLFDDDAAPVAVFLVHEADFGEALDDVSEVVGRGGEVEEKVAVGIVFLVDLCRAGL